MPRFQIEKFAVVINGADLIWINVLVLLFVFSNSVVSPGSFPESSNELVLRFVALMCDKSYLYNTRKYSSAWI